MSKRSSISYLAAVLLGLLAAFVAAGCGGSDGASGPSVSDPWARTSAAMQTRGAAYMTITGGSEDDRLIAASVPAEIAAEAQLHETVAMDTSSGTGGMATTPTETSGGMSGGMTMREVDAIDVPAGEDVELKPGGYHVMLMELPEPLEEGQTFDLTLTFEKAGDQVVTVTVRNA